MRRILSGIQPSGIFHLGNYFGMMQRMIAYQNQEDSPASDGKKNNQLFVFIANYHALTLKPDPEKLQQQTLEMAADYVALGLDPQKSIFWVQSDLPQIAELTWILTHHASVSRLELAHGYKDKVAQGQQATAGLFTYPILMTADILAFATNIVPVGKDQAQHLEICREIARSFNHLFGKVFTIPQADILPDQQLVVGIDGRKMSKSYQNMICPLAAENLLKKSIMSIRTDSAQLQDKKDSSETPLFQIFSLFASTADAKDRLIEKFNQQGSSYQKIKLELFSLIMDTFAPARARRQKISKPEILEILADGSKKAKEVAQPILKKCRDACGISYRSG